MIARIQRAITRAGAITGGLIFLGVCTVGSLKILQFIGGIFG